MFIYSRLFASLLAWLPLIYKTPKGRNCCFVPDAISCYSRVKTLRSWLTSCGSAPVKNCPFVADFYAHRRALLGSVLSQCNADHASHVYLSKHQVNIISFLCLTVNAAVLLLIRGIPYFILGLDVYFNDIIFLQHFISFSKRQLS